MKKDGERLAKLETEMQNIEKSQEIMGKSIEALHGKFDALQLMITTNYVAKDTFEEYKKNKWLERILIALITGIISFGIALILRSFNV